MTSTTGLLTECYVLQPGRFGGESVMAWCEMMPHDKHCFGRR